MAAEAFPDGERRARRWSLAAIALLLPALAVAHSWRSVRDMAHNRELFVAGPDATTEAAYAGARLRLSSFRVIADSPDPRLALPPDRALVLVRLKARLARDVGDDWVICRLTLRDGQGRAWAPTGVSFPPSVQKLVEPDGVAPPSCASAAFSKPKAGAEVEFGASYVTPRDALPTLKARFSIMAERPWAIEFATPDR